MCYEVKWHIDDIPSTCLMRPKSDPLLAFLALIRAKEVCSEKFPSDVCKSFFLISFCTAETLQACRC